MKTLPFQFFGNKKLIYHLKDLENILYEIYALVQKKSCVKLFTDIKNSDPSHELGPVRRRVMKPLEGLQGLFWSICIETTNIQRQKENDERLS